MSDRREWRLVRARGQVLVAPSAPLPVLPLTSAHRPPLTPPPGEAVLSRRQRVKRFGRDLLVDRVCGRLGLRVFRRPGPKRPPRERERRPGRSSRAVVLAETVDCLIDAVARADAVAGVASRVTVMVAWWSAPWRGWTGRPGALPGLVGQRVRFPARGRGPVRVDLLLTEPLPLADALASALFALRPSTAIDGVPRAVAHVTEPGQALVLVDEQRVNPRGRRPEAYRTDAPRFGLRIGAARPVTRAGEPPSAEPAAAGPSGAQASRAESLGAAPSGAQSSGGGPSLGGHLAAESSGAPDAGWGFGSSASLAPVESGRNLPPWEWPGALRWRRGAEPELSWRTLTALRSVGTVECGRVSGVDPAAEASLLAQLAMTGVVLHAPELSPAVADLLAPDLRAILAEPLPAYQSGPLWQEIRSVRQRRAALRGHSVQFGRYRPPSVSAILATKRTEHLPDILRAIAEQTYPNLEIVLCLHGIELPDACADYLAQCGRSVRIVPVAADVVFGVALGLATGMAGGTLVTKFDDDDTYGPEHVWDLVLARGYSGATLVGKGIEFVYLEDAGVTVRRRSGQPEADTDVVAGGTMLIARSELEELGGWRPVPRSVDRGLLDRVNRAGARVYRTHPLGYLYHRRSQGHTWTADDEFFLRTARQRWDGLLRLPEFGTTTPLEASL